MINKRPKNGYRLRWCSTCKRKRHIWRISLQKDIVNTCSRGHTWELTTTEQIDIIIRDMYEPLVAEMLSNKNPLMEYLNGRRRKHA
jgi:hypothetical protein